MGQYTVAKYIFDHGPATKEQIVTHTDDSSASVAQSITELKRRGLIERRSDLFHFHPEATEEDLERIRPRTISELQDE